MTFGQTTHTMETLVNLGVEVLRLVPLILAFYIPALLGTVVLKERAEAYRIKAALWFVFGFGGIIAVQLLLGGASASQVAQTIGLSLIQIAAALALAAYTVYRLAD